jgi:hypothetical protein
VSPVSSELGQAKMLRVPAVVSSILQSQGLKKDRIFDTVLYGGAPPSKVLAAEVKKRWPNAGLCVLLSLF